MKKFIKGCFELEEGVTDLVAFEAPREPQLMNIINWATENNIGVKFGTAVDDTYLCEFKVTARTLKMCKSYVAELKAMLKVIFPKARIVWEGSGDCLW